MNADVDTLIAAWLDEGPTELPEDARQLITSSIRTTPHYRQRAGRSWRHSSMPNSVRLALGAAAVVALVVGGVYLLRPAATPSTVGGPSMSPSPGPSAAPSSTWPPNALPLGTITLTDTGCGTFGFSDRVNTRRGDIAIALFNGSTHRGTYGWYRLNDGRTWDEARAWTAAANQAIADGTNLPPADFVTELRRWEVEPGQRAYMVLPMSATAGTHGMLCTALLPATGELHRIHLVGPIEIEE